MFDTLLAVSQYVRFGCVLATPDQLITINAEQRSTRYPSMTSTKQLTAHSAGLGSPTRLRKGGGANEERVELTVTVLFVFPSCFLSSASVAPSIQQVFPERRQTCLRFGKAASDCSVSFLFSSSDGLVEVQSFGGRLASGNGWLWNFAGEHALSNRQKTAHFGK